MPLTHQENEDLTRVGPGTVMGEMLRRYWHPVVRSSRLVADGAPVRVQLLGENYVAFRATDGRVGFFDEACPHRGVSLALAHNSGNGLRCIFHGWKIDVSGNLVQVPTEPKHCAEQFAQGVKVRKFPVREAGGLLWVYPRLDGEPAPFPDYEFLHLPESHVDIRFGLFRVNWLQALESVIDSAHLGQLHRSSLAGSGQSLSPEMQRVLFEATAPAFEILDTPYGFREGAIRTLSDGARHVMLREFAAPYFSFLPTGPDMTRVLCGSIPHDDHWMSQLIINYDLHAPLSEEFRENLWATADPDPDNFAGDLGSIDNLWRQDREAMQNGHASGFPGRHVFQEDFIVQESMGSIVDRTKEHLGSSDTVVAHVRKKLLEGAYALRGGGHGWGLGDAANINYRRLRSTNRMLAPGEDWRAIDVVGEQEGKLLAVAS